MISDNYFHLCVTGQISAAYFPIGMDSKQIFCRYDVVMGKDWEIVSGNYELQKKNHCFSIEVFFHYIQDSDPE